MAILRAAATANFTLDNTGTAALITGLTLTPAADDYFLYATIEFITPSAAPAEDDVFSVWVGGTQIDHTRRTYQGDTSIDDASIVYVLSCKVSPGGSDDVEIRHTRTSASAPCIASNREMTLLPIPAAGTDYEESSTSNDSTTSGTFSTIVGMARTPVSGTYLVAFSSSATGASNQSGAFRISVDGTPIAHTLREIFWESSGSSQELAIGIFAEVTVNGSEEIEIEFATSSTVTVHDRTMNLIPVASDDIFEASGTADDTDSTTTDKLLDDMTITDPGADDYLTMFSMSVAWGTLSGGDSGLVTLSVHEGGSVVTDSERLNEVENSLDNTYWVAFCGGRVTVGGGTDDLEIFWQGATTNTRTGRERTFVAIRELSAPASATISDVDSDYGAASDEFDVDENVLDVNGAVFEAVQGTGTVWLADETTLAASDAEVDLAAAIGTWGDTEIILDLTNLSAGDLTDIEALIVSDGPALFIILVNDSAEETSLPVTVHRAKAFAMSLSANIAASGENTTGQLTAPAAGSFGGGRIQDDENPADTVDIGDGEYFEDEWCIEALPASVLGETYLFRVLIDADPADTITVIPGLTIAVGGTLFFQTVTGAVAPAGATVKETLKALAGANTPAGTISRETLKLVAGSVTPTGVVVKKTLKVLAGVVTPSGALATATLFFRTLTGALTPTGAVIKQVQKKVAGSLTPTGGITVRDVLKNVAGTVAPSGVIVRRTNKNVDGVVAPSGVLTSASVFFRSIAGALTPVGAIVKQVQKKVSGSVASAGVMVRDISKSVAGVVTPTGAVNKFTTKIPFLGAVTPTGELTAITIFLRAVAGVLTPTGAITKETQKKVAGSLTPTGVMTRGTQKNIAGAVTPTGAMTKETQKALAGAVTPTSILATLVTIKLSVVGFLTPAGAVTKRTEKSVAGDVGPTGALNKKTTKIPFLGSVTPASVLQTGLIIGKSIAGALTPTGGLGTIFTPGSAGDRMLRKMFTVVDRLRHKPKNS